MNTEVKKLELLLADIEALEIASNLKYTLFHTVKAIAHQFSHDPEAYISELVNALFYYAGLILGENWAENEPHQSYLLKATEIEQIEYVIKSLSQNTEIPEQV